MAAENRSHPAQEVPLLVLFENRVLLVMVVETERYNFPRT